MQYRILGKTGLKVSILGFGCMRLPLKDKEKAIVDENEAIRLKQAKKLLVGLDSYNT